MTPGGFLRTCRLEPESNQDTAQETSPTSEAHLLLSPSLALTEETLGVLMLEDPSWAFPAQVIPVILASG